MKKILFLVLIVFNLCANRAILGDIKYSIPISKPQIANGTTFSITSPGYYNLSGDLSFTSAVASVNVIEIKTNDVVLDLNTFSIRTDNSSSGLTAISIDAGISNVFIKNGSIFSVTGAGIKGNSGCKNIRIDSMFFNDCDDSGIHLDGVLDSSITSCEITNTTGTATGTAAVGLLLNLCKNLQISNSNFNSSTSVTIPAKGVFLTSCINCNFKDCVAATNVGTSGYGFHLSNSDTCKFVACSANDNRGIFLDGFGFACNSSITIQFNCCNALSNDSLTTNAYGFFFSGSNFNKCVNCTSSNQSGSYDGHGFFTTAGKGNQFEECLASGNQGGSSMNNIGSGFTFRASETNSLITSCQSLSNGSSVGEGYGIKFGAIGETISNCTVRNNQLSTNIGGAKKYGFKDFTENMTTLLTNNLAFAQGKVFPLSNGQIADNGFRNYMFTFTSPGKSAMNMLIETDNSTLTTLDTKSPFANISIY
jgi:hypothetical protein